MMMNFKSVHFGWSFFAVMVFALSLGCFPAGLPSSSLDCDPERDEDCVCFLEDTGEEVNDCVDGETSENEFCACELDRDTTPENPESPESPEEGDPQPPESFRFVLVEDLTPNPQGDFPGADIDAISVIKANGEEFYAQSFETETDIECEGNLACDPSALLGEQDFIGDGECPAPDAADPRFTSLNGGFVIAQFSSISNGDVAIENGDDIHVYEVGSTECGRFDDDPFRVSVSVSDEIGGAFTEVGIGGQGENIVPVTGL
jgi:hypothetical protein